MGDILWTVATSNIALGADGLLWILAAVVGFVPFGKYMPVIGPYVPVARLVSVLLALLICFLIGFRIADERETSKNLRATIAAQSKDIAASRKAETDANRRASEIEKSADDQRKADDEYISTLKLAAGCGFEPFPGRVHDGSISGAGVPRSAADAAKADDAAASPGARSAVPLSVVRRRWLPWERP